MIKLEWLLKNTGYIGVAACIISVGTWLLDIYEIVYACPYCRVQRTVIGILGLILMSRIAHLWLVKFIALGVGFFGSTIASFQHFLGWKKVSDGDFEFNATLMTDPTILSGIALYLIIGLTFIILQTESLQVIQERSNDRIQNNEIV